MLGVASNVICLIDKPIAEIFTEPAANGFTVKDIDSLVGNIRLFNGFSKQTKLLSEVKPAKFNEVILFSEQ